MRAVNNVTVPGSSRTGGVLGKAGIARRDSRRARLGMAIFAFCLFTTAGAINWVPDVVLSLLLFVFAVAGPLVYLVGQARVDARREESRALVEAARLGRKEVIHRSEHRNVGRRDRGRSGPGRL